MTIGTAISRVDPETKLVDLDEALRTLLNQYLTDSNAALAANAKVGDKIDKSATEVQKAKLALSSKIVAKQQAEREQSVQTVTGDKEETLQDLEKFKAVIKTILVVRATRTPKPKDSDPQMKASPGDPGDGSPLDAVFALPQTFLTAEYDSQLRQLNQSIAAGKVLAAELDCQEAKDALAEAEKVRNEGDADLVQLQTEAAKAERTRRQALDQLAKGMGENAMKRAGDDVDKQRDAKAIEVAVRALPAIEFAMGQLASLTAMAQVPGASELSAIGAAYSVNVENLILAASQILGAAAHYQEQLDYFTDAHDKIKKLMLGL
jgi:hypothetical protein